MKSNIANLPVAFFRFIFFCFDLFDDCSRICILSAKIEKKFEPFDFMVKFTSAVASFNGFTVFAVCVNQICRH